MRIHGRNGVVYLAAKFGGTASPLSFTSDWTINAVPARPDITSIPDRQHTYGPPELPDVSGDFSGWYDDATAQVYAAVTDGLPRSFYLYPTAREPWRYFYGLILPDFSTGGGVGSAVPFKSTWNAAGAIGQAGGDQTAPAEGAMSDAPAAISPSAIIGPPTIGPPFPIFKTRPVVTYIAGEGQFYTLAKSTTTPSGHSFRVRRVPGWAWGNGISMFYTRATPDGQVVMTSVPMTQNELQPTGTTAELCIYNPVTGDFYRQVIPTILGATSAASPTSGYGGTDVGGGDVVLAFNNGVPVIVCTCEGYYFGWPILTTGLFPTLALFAKSGSRWLFLPFAVNFLTGQNTGFEGGIGNWSASVNCSVADTAAQAHTGADSLGITSTAGGDMIAASCTAGSILSNGMPVVPGPTAQVLVSAYVRTAVSARACTAGVAFYDGSGNPVGGNTFGTAANDTTTGWTQISAVVPVPAGAAFCRALIDVAATAAGGELHYCDDVTLQPIGAASLTGDQWELTNPAAFTSVIGAGGQSAGNGANYWGTRGIGQMATLPRSGNIVIGHYFNTGSGTNAGCISVISPAGQLLAAYQIPNVTPNSGTITSLSCRDVEADPTSPLGDERFVIMYDAFGTGAGAGHPYQEFSYNATGHSTVLSNGVTVPAGGIAPVSAPCEPADTSVVDCSFCCFGPDGSLYVTTFATGGLAAANLQVYLKPPGGMRSICTAAPATGTWASTAYKTQVPADYSLGMPAALGLGALDGPPIVDPASNSLLIPGASGRLGILTPNSIGIGGTGPNLLSASASGFEPPQAFITDDQIFATSRGTWNPFLGSFTGPSVPPVAPPAGTNAMHCTPFSGSLVGQTAHYSVAASTSYQVIVNFLATTATRTCEVYFQYYNAAGSVISTSSHVTAVDSAAAWTAIKNTAATPAGTVAMQVFFVVDSPGAGEVHWVSSCALRNLDPRALGWGQFVTNIAITDAQALDGTYSLAISAPFNSETLDAISPSFPVTQFCEYRAQAWLRAAATPQPVKLVFSWFNAAGTQLSQSGPTLTATDSTSGWTMTQTTAMAPAGAVTANLNVEPTTSVVNETHYLDRVSVVQQPWTSQPFVDYMLNTLRALNGGAAVSIGRPTLLWPYLLIPVSQGLTSAETTAYNTNSYVPAPKPQYLAAVDLSQLLAT